MTDESAALPANEEQTQSPVDVSGIDGAASILGQLFLDTGDPIDRGRLRRVIPEHSSPWGNASRLREFIGNPGTQDVLRCVIVERSVAYGDVVSVHAEKMSSLARLWALLRPERSDIFVLLAFSLVVGLLTLAVPIASQSLVDTVAFGRFLQPVVVLTLLLLAFLSFSAAIQGLESYVVEIIQCRLFDRVSADLTIEPLWRVISNDGRTILRAAEVGAGKKLKRLLTLLCAFRRRSLGR